MNKQQAIEQLRELRDSHGDVSLPVSRVISILEGLEAPQSNPVTIDRNLLINTISEEMETSFSDRDVSHYSLTMDSSNTVELEEVVLKKSVLKDYIERGVDEYFSQYHPELEAEDA